MLGTGISHSLPGLHGLSTPWRITLSDIYQSERSYSEKFHFVKLCGAPSVLYSPVDILFVVSVLMQYLAKYPLCVDFKLKLTEFSYHCQTLLLWVYLTVSNMKTVFETRSRLFFYRQFAQACWKYLYPSILIQDSDSHLECILHPKKN
jgi:hypothetical protein